MEDKKRKKYGRIAKITGVLIGLVLVLGISYAVFKNKSLGERINRIHTGTFDVIIENEEEINLNNEGPKREKKALEGSPFSFTVKNIGTIEAMYTMYLEVDQESTLSSNVVRYYLTKTDKEGKESIVTNNSKILEEGKTTENVYKIDVGRIKQQESYRYKLYLWVDIEASIEEAMNKTLSGKIKIDAEQYNGNHNIVKALKYNQNKNAKNYCITGLEETCEESLCYLNKEKKACPSGTIFIYNVNDTSKRYFYVLHDDGEEMTLQQRENISNQAAWSLETDESGNYTNTKGPTEALRVLEEATKDWTNVEEQTYTLGETVFLEGSNAYTGCGYNPSYTCTKNIYTMETRTARARIITQQEAYRLGCTDFNRSCPIFIYNYLSTSASNGGTNNGYSYQYWTLSADLDTHNVAINIASSGRFFYSNSATTVTKKLGIRPVIVIKK